MEQDNKSTPAEKKLYKTQLFPRVTSE